ncbi:MAG: sulfate ABC transporter permease [Lamprocystis purpurea]|jgi:sulfate transport system permease protein|uniref:sulfate ABC transporter permease n=1 Tax=Lamprocystis purpurea TaxID=61598 RepID=UPI000367B1F8|nr:sulfate ABC transporter permease subunit [Lamprocystis purpurea]MBV5274920.1 sulfate ABC transporter permease [Lamprocystis purpurea]
MARRARTRQLTGAQRLIVLLVFAYLGLILVLPLGAMVIRALEEGPGILLLTLTEPAALQGLLLTLMVAAICVTANGIFGVAGALVLTRHRFLGRRVLDALVDLPLAVSPVMTGLAFLLIFGRGGWLDGPLDLLGLKVTFAVPGLVLATLFVTFPFTLREVAYVLEELGTSEEQAAMTLGASPWQTFWLVTLPNIRFGLGYGIVLTLARALGEFGAVLVVGGAISGRTQTATTFIYNALEERQEAAAYGMALLLAVISVALLVAIEWLKRRRERGE